MCCTFATTKRNTMGEAMQHITTKQAETRNQTKGAAMFQLYETLQDYGAVALAFQSDNNNVRAAVSREKNRVKAKALETNGKFEAVPEKSGAPITGKIPKAVNYSVPGGKARPVAEFFKTISMLDIAYTVNVAAAFYGMWFFLNLIGLFFGAIYALLSFHALGMAKRNDTPASAELAIQAVWALELVASVFHFATINYAIWHYNSLETGEKLPFRIYENLNAPSIIAGIFAFVALVGGVYCVQMTLNISKEKTK